MCAVFQGIQLPEVEALHPLCGDRSQHPALQVFRHTDTGIRAGYTARGSVSTPERCRETA